MKRIFFTEEGRPYVIRTVSKRYRGEWAIGGTLTGSININQAELTGDASYLGLEFKTDKPVIPIIAACSIYKAISQVIIADFRTPFFSMTSGGTPEYLFDHVSAMNKLTALATRDFYSSEALYSWAIRYPLAAFSTFDFIDPRKGISFLPVKDYLSATGGLPGDNYVVTSEADVIFTATFSYFELQ
jgi:hypothetical protein